MVYLFVSCWSTNMSEDKNRIQTLERQLERERRYNEDLVKQNESLSSEVAHLKGSISRHDVAVQTDPTPRSSAAGEADWTTQAQAHGGSIADSVKSFLASKSSEIERKEFVYSEALGMYVNETNGMMYDGKRYLYYDYNKNEYMYYDEASGTYKEDPARKKNKVKPKKKIPKDDAEEPKDQMKKPEVVDLTYSDSEEGEVDDDEDEKSKSSSPKPEKVIPCVRLIVYSSKTLPPASLYIATCDRSFTFGRDAKRDMVLDEDLVSKYHAVISYDKETSSYRVQDFGSQNGTFLNSVRLSAPKEVSEKKEITHQDLLVIGSTTLIVHIHENSETCDDCEPGVYLSKLQSFKQYAGNEPDSPVKTQTSIKISHKEEMKNIKKRYGLQKDHFMEVPAGSNPDDYVDRSKVRRIVVGSEHPSLAPKDAPSASVDVPIADNNVGFKLLSKMGWNEGEGLNSKRKADSLTAPIATTIRINEAAGLGAEAVGEQLSLDDVRLKQQKEKWAKAAKRYHGLPTQTSTDTKGKDSASKSGNIQWVKGEKSSGGL